MCLSARLSFLSASLRRPTIFAPPLSPVLIFRLFFSLAPHTAFIGRQLSSADAPVLFSDTPLLFRHTHFSRHSTPNRRHDRSQDRYAIIAIIATSLSSPLSPRLPSLPYAPRRPCRPREVAASPSRAHLQRRLRSAAAAAAQLQRGGLCEAHRIAAQQFSPPCGCALWLGRAQRLWAAANYT